MIADQIKDYRVTYDTEYWKKHIHEVNQYGLRSIFIAACSAINALVDEIERTSGNAK